MRIRKFQREDAQRVSRLIRKALLEVNSMDYPKKVIDFMSVKLSSSITAHVFYKKRGYRDLRVNLDEDYGKTIIMRKKLRA